MYICRDVTNQLVVSIYWELDLLIVVAKSSNAKGELTEQAAWQFTQSEAQYLLDDLNRGESRIRSLNFDRLVAIAIGGRIAEGLLRRRREQRTRVDRYSWN